MLLLLSAVVLSTLSPTTAIIARHLVGKPFTVAQWVRRGPIQSTRTESAHFTKSESPEVVSGVESQSAASGTGIIEDPFVDGPPRIPPPPDMPSPPKLVPPPRVTSDMVSEVTSEGASGKASGGVSSPRRESGVFVIDPSKEETPPPPVPPSEYTYAVIAPKRIRKGQDMIFCVEFRYPVYNQTVHAVLTGRWENKNETYAEVKQVINDGSQMIKMALPIPTDINWRANQINFTGYGDVNFKNTSGVNLAYKSKSIFVHTDKAMYKPGQTVQYKAFVTDSGLNLLDPQLEIEIYDPQGHKIVERKNVSYVSNGVSGEVFLSDDPLLGNWRIDVKIPDEDISESLYFEVAEYVLPKYEVTVDLPPYGTKDDPEIRGTVKAKYTFGTPVKGVARLTVSKRYPGGFYDPRSIVTEFPIDGEAEFIIPMEHILRLVRKLENEQTLRVHANVTESLTGDTLGGSSEMKFYPKPYKVEFYPNLPDNFKPGFPYTAAVKVTQQDGRPLLNPQEPLIITQTCFTDVDVQLNHTTPQDIVFQSPFLLGKTIAYDPESHPLPENGILSFPVDIHELAATCNIKAEFRGESEFKDISRFRSPSDAYLKVESLTEKPKVGEDATFQVKSNIPPGDVRYYIVSKDQLVGSGMIHVNIANQGYPFTIKMKKEYAPNARMVAFFTTPEGEIVADAITFGLEDIFENKVMVGYDQVGTVSPGDNATLTIQAEPYSTVHVQVVDKSTQLLKSGNDITVDRVREELNEYGGGHMPRGWGFGIPYSVDADDSCDVFDNSNLALLTNADCYRFNLWQQASRPVAFSSGGAGAGARMMMDQGAPMMMQSDATSSFESAQMKQEAPRLRKDFPETWKWENATADVNGHVVIPGVVPDTITEWIANAYSLSDTKGLGVAPDPAKLVVFKDFFVNIDTPYSIVRGEQAVIQGNVFNDLPVDVYAKVTLAGSDQFVSIVSDGFTETEETGDQERCVLVPAKGAAPVYFTIKPVDIGSVALRMTARAGGKADAVQKTLPVKPEGEPTSFNIPVLLSLQKPGQTIHEIKNITYPADHVPGSTRVRISLYDNVFGPSIEGLDKLIRMPYGTGEQNMVNFAPAVYASDYLKEVGALTEDLKKKTTDVLLTGYQRELIFQRNDGSFSAFGNADKTGSLWLTAFVAKSFSKANNQIYVDPAVVKRAVDFIIMKQELDGSFVDEGSLHHYGLSGGSRSNNVSLAAYTLIALQEVKDAEILKDAETLSRLDLAIAQTEDYIKRNIQDMTTDYEYAISAFAMKLTGNEREANILLDKLDSNTTVPALCKLPSETGPCMANFRRWYFNSQTGRCEEFTYGGCQGNDNNFETRESCVSVCRTQEKAVCKLPSQTGPCRASIPRWYFNSQTGRCEEFIYGGCQGNENNFKTKDSCESVCSAHGQDICTLPSETGRGRAFLRRWYFNSQSGECEQFTYGGVGGNDNNFETRAACENKCKVVKDGSCPPVPREMVGMCVDECQADRNCKGTDKCCSNGCGHTCMAPVDVCSLPSETGRGRAFFRRWYFNSQTGECEQFTYGGVGGNDNNFETRAACENKCIDICKLPSDTGMGRAAFRNWYFNSNTGQCEEFIYGGVGGNENNFETKQACEARCRPKEPRTSSQSTDTGSTVQFKDGKKHWRNKSKPMEIEIASYALLAHVTPATASDQPDIDSALPIFRWLVEQRNPYGGFMSTQDTVIGLQGFSEMAKLLHTPDYNMTVDVTVGGQTLRFDLNKENSDVYQFVDFRGDVPDVEVSAEGTGFGIVDIAVFYNVEKDPEPDSFRLDVNVTPDISNISTILNKFYVEVCASWLVSDQESGMVIMDIGAPSGYKLDKDKINLVPPVKQVDSDNDRVNVYLEKLDNDTVCVEIPATRTNVVAKVQPAFVKVYSVNDPDNFASRSYVPPGNDQALCEICGEKCGCGKQPIPLDMCTPGPVPLPMGTG